MSYRRLEYVAATSAALVSLVVYYITLAPTVSIIDSGELAADLYTLGIAHPTGYPLFTMIGFLFTHIPLGMRVIAQANLMSALLCSGGLFFFFRFILFALSVNSAKGFTRPQDPARRAGKEDVLRFFFPSPLAALVAGFF